MQAPPISGAPWRQGAPVSGSQFIAGHARLLSPHAPRVDSSCLGRPDAAVRPLSRTPSPSPLSDHPDAVAVRHPLADTWKAHQRKDSKTAFEVRLGLQRRQSALLCERGAGRSDRIRRLSQPRRTDGGRRGAAPRRIRSTTGAPEISAGRSHAQGSRCPHAASHDNARHIWRYS